MASPITAVVSHAAAQATPPNPTHGPRSETPHAHLTPQQMAAVSNVSAERQNAQMREETRVMKRQENRAEAGYAPQKGRRQRPARQGAAQVRQEDEQPQADAERHVDVEV